MFDKAIEIIKKQKSKTSRNSRVEKYNTSTKEFSSVSKADSTMHKEVSATWKKVY